MELNNPWPFNEIIRIPALQDDSLMHNDFVGVKIGDVNNTVQAHANQILPRGGRRTLSLNVESTDEVKAGQIVEVKLKFPEILEGFQWTLQTQGLAYENVKGDMMEINAGNVGQLNDGILTMSWNEPHSITEGNTDKMEQVLHLQFMAIESGRLSDMLQLTSLVTDAEAYTPDGEILDVKLEFNKTRDEFALYQNEPNPWNASTTIGFDLPHDSNARLTIFDSAGKVVKVMEASFKAGYNNFVIKSNDISSPGILYYRLESGEYSASKKMVLIK